MDVAIARQFRLRSFLTEDRAAISLRWRRLGMTRTANELITSDGPAILHFRSPDTFDETHHIVVRDGQKLVDQLNELEYIKGEIYANGLALRSDCAYIAARRACDRVDRSYWAASR